MNKLLTIPLLFGLMSSVWADSKVDSMKVSSKLTKTCTISMNDVNIGVIPSQLTGNTHVNTSIQVLCNKQTPFKLSTEIPEVIKHPLTGGNLGYTYKLLYINDESEQDFIGYRFILDGSTTTTRKFFGTGSPTSLGTSTYTIDGIGTGEIQNMPVILEYYMYYAIRAGVYAAPHVFNISF